MKWIVRGLLLLVVLVIVAVAVVFLFIDPILKKGVEHGGTYAMGVENRLESARLRPFLGELGLYGLVIDNPPGFEADDFFALETGEVELSLVSLMSDKVVVPRIEFENIALNLEKSGDKANYVVILENVKKLSDSEKAPPEPEKEPEKTPEEGPGKTFAIEKLRIADIKVHLKWDDRKFDVKIKEIPLSNIGTDGDKGVRMEDVAGIVITAILDAVAKNPQNLIPPELLGDLEGELAKMGSIGDYAGVKFQEFGAAASESVEKLADDIDKAIGEGTKDLGEDVEKTTNKLNEKLDGLFKR